MPRVIFHLDMDAFYASVEQRDNPGTRGKPVIVGASPDRRGVVCAASYEARAFGVHSAMPSRTAHCLCPQGIFLSPRMAVYGAESRLIMERISGFAGAIEQMSVDEAYLDMSHRFEGLGVDEAIRAAMELGRELKAIIRRERGLTASIGIAGNKLLAKIASDYGKPDGLFCIPESGKKAFLRPLPASAIHGVGKVTAQVLAKAGMHTIGDIQDHPGDLRALVGSFGPTLKRYASGEDDRPLEVEGEVKSVSVEDTFERDTEDRRILVPALKQQSEEVARKLSRERLAARTVQVKVRYGDFRTLTRQISVEDPVEDARVIYALACALLRRERLVNRPLRLLGLGVTRLVPPASQLLLPL
ncbi:MAG: DNA polymerase IV [Chthoniobacteraceae bacterium]|nr:DNA polymerase IV [Chthoniobacteraceae bacterium]